MSCICVADDNKFFWHVQILLIFFACIQINTLSPLFKGIEIRAGMPVIIGDYETAHISPGSLHVDFPHVVILMRACLPATETFIMAAAAAVNCKARELDDLRLRCADKFRGGKGGCSMSVSTGSSAEIDDTGFHV